MGIRKKFTKNGFMLLDTSYFNHYMIGRAYNYYKDHFDVPQDKKEVWKIDFSKNKQYLQILTGCYINGLKELLAKYGIAKGDIILATDCKRRNIWRLDIFPDYKISRFMNDRKEEGINKGPIFNYINDKLLPYVLKKYNFGDLVSHPYAEGDDVISVCKDYIRELDPKMLIYIITNDSDIVQKIDKYTIIRNMEEENLRKRIDKYGNLNRFLAFKIIRGDKGDDIPSCFTKVKGDKVLSRGCGDKTAMKLLDDPKLLKEKFKEYPTAARKYRLNQKLIDLRNIPDIIAEAIKDDIKDKIVI
jgi:5'-3' exonuclease